MQTGSLKAVFPFLHLQNCRQLLKKAKRLRHVVLYVQCVHMLRQHIDRIISVRQRAKLVSWSSWSRCVWCESPQKKVFLFQTVWKITFMEPATLIQLNPFIINKEMRFPLISVLVRSLVWRFFANQIHEKKPFSEAEIQSLGIECDMPPLPVVVRKATGIWRLGSRFSVYFGSMETPGLSWDDCKQFWFDWLGDDEIPNLETKDEGIESRETYCLWTCCMIGRKYSEDQARQNMMPSFVLRERERGHAVQIWSVWLKSSLKCVRVGTVCSCNSWI